MQKQTADNARFHAVRNEIIDIAMHLNAQESEKRRQRATRRALRARRGIEDHFESRRLALQCSEEEACRQQFG